LVSILRIMQIPKLSKAIRYKLYFSDGGSTIKWVRIGSYASWVMAGIYFLIVLCLFNNIKIATAVMKTSAIFIA